jgi:hypothetical protein
MKDKFEIFVRGAVSNTVSTFPQHSEQNWVAINGKLQKKYVKRRFFRLGIAASILLVMGTSLFFVFHGQNAAMDYYAKTTNEINETVYNYSYLIDVKYNQITQIENIDREYFKLFFDEMDLLDKEYERYLNDAEQFGFQEDIVRAMLENQQKKLLIINRLLFEIKKTKNYENNKFSI